MSSGHQSIDLDFQSYPSTSGVATIPQQSDDKQVRIDLSDSSIPSANKTNENSLNSILSRFNLDGSGGQSNPGLSDEAIQQLLVLSGKQRSKQSRESKATSGNWGLGYLAQYFEVTSEDVYKRIIWSAIPIRKRGSGLDDLELTAPLASNMENLPSGDSNNIDHKYFSYIERFIQSRPDIYGPFWISVTLIFSVAIFSNLVNFINFKNELNKHNETDSNKNIENWHYSMSELNLATSAIIFQVIFLPTIIWFTFWFRGCTRYYTLIETMCAYGYSISIFIPVSALLMVQELMFRYIVIGVASIVSGLTLMLSFLPIVRSESAKGGSLLILVAVPALQFLLAFILHKIMLQTTS